jgi:hypothetical protein
VSATPNHYHDIPIPEQDEYSFPDLRLNRRVFCYGQVCEFPDLARLVPTVGSEE